MVSGHLANGHFANAWTFSQRTFSHYLQGEHFAKIMSYLFVITFVFMYVQFMDAANIIIIADFCTLIYNQL